MGKSIVDINIADNSEIFKQATDEAIARILEMIGQKAEGYAKLKCPVDTGVLQNSISHTVQGKTVYIGTNVEYAPYVEKGHINAKTGKHVPAKPFLEPTITEHKDEYKNIAKSVLKGGN